MKRALALSVAIAALVAPATALGHATVQSTSPARGAALEQAPRQVVLRFSENVETQFGAVRVFDADGKRVDQGTTIQPTASSAAVRLRAGLPEGPVHRDLPRGLGRFAPGRRWLTFTVGRSGGQSAAAVDSLIDAGGAGPVTTRRSPRSRAGLRRHSAADRRRRVPLAGVVAGGARGGGPGGALAARVHRRCGARPFDRHRCGGGRGGLSTAGIVLQGATAAGTSFGGAGPTVVHDVLATGFGTAWAPGWRDSRLLAVLWLPPARARTGAAPGLGGRHRSGVAAAPRPVGPPPSWRWPLAITPALSGHANATDPRARCWPPTRCTWRP